MPGIEAGGKRFHIPKKGKITQNKNLGFLKKNPPVEFVYVEKNEHQRRAGLLFSRKEKRFKGTPPIQDREDILKKPVLERPEGESKKGNNDMTNFRGNEFKKNRKVLGCHLPVKGGEELKGKKHRGSSEGCESG